jgi:hypothetical protein
MSLGLGRGGAFYHWQGGEGDLNNMQGHEFVLEGFTAFRGRWSDNCMKC